MSAELIGILSVGGTLLTVNIVAAPWLGGWLRTLNGHIADLRERMARLEERMNSLEGHLNAMEGRLSTLESVIVQVFGRKTVPQ